MLHPENDKGEIVLLRPEFNFMSITLQIKQAVQLAIQQVYQTEIALTDILINETKPEFEGDYTLVTFAFSKKLGLRPDEIAQKLGESLLEKADLIQGFNVVKGFLNMVLKEEVLLKYLHQIRSQTNFGMFAANGQKVMIEYSSPNTNKPLHFGHLRNIFLGSALSNLLKNNGYEVVKANLINDRGIHICKSMIAWQKFANGANPENTGIKGDHLVGDYYVRFNDEYKIQIQSLKDQGMSQEEAEKKAPIMLEAQEMLRQWESGDPETLTLWKTMNDWVYSGFYHTYQRMGISFDAMYYESNTYLSGKEIVEKGLANGHLFKKEDGSVWVDLKEDGLDEKLLLRGDGTSVYITQDIGTAVLKYNEHHMQRSVYVIGDEQNYHMQVLKLILQKLNEPCAEGIFHLSYGMVELPSGKMKSREGTVVDADDMVDEMIATARKNTEELGKVDDFNEEELQTLYHTLGLGALKFYLLRVDPKKRMIFNPQESIDFHGFTGPFVQFTHARISSIFRKANPDWKNETTPYEHSLNEDEKGLIRMLDEYPLVLQQAGEEYNLALLCNYLHHLAKSFNGFLTQHSVLKAESAATRLFRLQLSEVCKHVIQHGLSLLGVDAPERM